MPQAERSDDQIHWLTSHTTVNGQTQLNYWLALAGGLAFWLAAFYLLVAAALRIPWNLETYAALGLMVTGGLVTTWASGHRSMICNERRERGLPADELHASRELIIMIVVWVICALLILIRA